MRTYLIIFLPLLFYQHFSFVKCGKYLTVEQLISELALRIKELQHRQEQLHARKNEIENVLPERRVELIDLETMTGYASEMQGIVLEGLPAHRKAFICGFVKDIRVAGEKAVLSYSPPGLPNKVELNLEGVPRIVQYGGPFWVRTRDLSLIRTEDCLFIVIPPFWFSFPLIIQL